MKKTLLILLFPTMLFGKSEAVIDNLFKVVEINSWDNRMRDVWYSEAQNPTGRFYRNRSHTTAYPHVGSVIHEGKSLPNDIYEVIGKESIFVAPKGEVKKKFFLTLQKDGLVKNYPVKAGVYQTIYVGDFVRPMGHFSEYSEFWKDILSGLFGHPYFWYLD